MNYKLPINLKDLLRQRKLEGDRIEYKAGWYPGPIMRTLCAFANDFENLGGGYVVIGQDCDESGLPLFPPVGLPDNQLDKIQRELLAFCNQIRPAYSPRLSIERFEGYNLIILWAPRGQNPPYKVPFGEIRSLKSDLPNGTFEFARRIVRLCRHLEAKPGVSSTLANQLLRSGTSVGANIEEGEMSLSDADFIRKYNLACKEARETHYWLRLLSVSKIVQSTRIDPLLKECDELIVTLTSIIKKLRARK